MGPNEGVRNEGFDRVFGSPRLSFGLFDRWWTMRRLLRDDDTESMRPVLRQFLPLVDRTGIILVDLWLDWVREEKEKRTGLGQASFRAGRIRRSVS